MNRVNYRAAGAEFFRFNLETGEMRGFFAAFRVTRTGSIGGMVRAAEGMSRFPSGTTSEWQKQIPPLRCGMTNEKQMRGFFAALRMTGAGVI
jgi:hypothetical protein